MTFQQIIKLFVIFFVCQSGISQHLPLSFNYLTIDDGLSCNTVEHIVEDSVGYLWFGGPQGLNRFDGYEIRRYYSSVNDSTSLPDNQILSLFCDSFGRLWIGTTNGIVLYHHEKDEFVGYNYFENETFGYNSRLVNYIGEDTDGVTWFATENGLFFKYNENDDEFVYRELTVLDPIQVKSFYFDEDCDHVLWIGANIGLIRYDLEEEKYQIFSLTDLDYGNFLSLNVNCILPDGRFLWLGIYRIGVVRFDRINYEFKVYRMENYNENYILSGSVDSDDNLWFSTGGGLFLYDRRKDLFHKYAHSPDNPDGPNVSGMSCLFEDSHQIYWLGTSYGGVNYSLGPQVFKSYQIDPHRLRKIPEKAINSFMLDDSGLLWVPFSSGMDVLDKKSMKLVHAFSSVDDNRHLLGSGTVWDVVKSPGNHVWVATYTGGLQKYDRDNHKFISYLNYSNNSQQKIGQDIRDIFPDDSGNLWLAMHGHGFSRFDLQDEKFFNFRIDEARSYLDWTYCIHVDHLDRIWVGTSSGLFKYSQDLQQYQEFGFNSDDSTSLSYNTVNVIFRDSENNLWIGTRRGLNFFDEDLNGFRRLGIQDGLVNDNITAIEEDDNQILWVSTRGGGIFSFSRKKWLQEDVFEPRFFDKGDGLQSDEFTVRSSFKDQEGYLYFGGINGFTIFHPDSIRKNSGKPEVIISKVKLFNKVIYPAPDSPVKINDKTFEKELELQYHQNILSIEFTAFNFRQPAKNEYLYKLDGFDDRWYSPNANREAVYTNLPAGKYTFRVKASNNDGVWNEEGVTMNLTIFPPWWQTPLFHFSLAFFFVGITYLFFLWRVKAIKRQRAYLQKMVTKKTAQLERQNREIQEMATRVHEADQSKIQFFMNISHEFRTPLSLILAPLGKMMSMQELPAKVKTQLLFMERSAHRLMRLINQLLDMQKVDLKKLLLKVSQVNVVEYMRSIFHLFEFTARERGLVYSFHFDDSLKERLIWFDVDALEKIIYNLLSNAFKHTSEGGQVEIFVKWMAGNGKLQVVVKDSGAGIPDDRLPHVFERYFSRSLFGGSSDGVGIGLTLVKELVELHRGSITVESEVGQGTVFKVELPARKEDFDSSEVRDDTVVESIKSESQVYDNMSVFDKTVVSKTNYNVLLAEDDEDLLQFLHNELSEIFSVKTVTNGMDAWQECRNYCPDIVVSDVMMPRMDGMELCQKIKTDENLGHIPVLLLTAKSEDEDVMAGYSTGADAYMTKPFNPELLKTRISNLIQSRKKLRKRFDKFTNVKQSEKDFDNADNFFLDKAISLIERNISNSSFGHKELAAEMNVGKTSLYTKISELTGYSTNVFIRVIRLKHAGRLLKNGNYNISEVSYQVGFNDPNYFSKCFKEYYHVTPKDYK